MIDFRTLGATELEENLGSKARPIFVQSKRLALLAYLALASDGRYRRRDSIVALFWPDLDDEHARGALRQALSYLRRILGADVVTTRGEEEIALAPGALRCDAVLFDAAVATGRLDEAMALYRGDFLAGLFVSDASPELEQWIDDERARLRRSAAWCCWSLANASCDRGDRIAAATWGRRTTALVPDDEGKQQWLIELFDSIGDRAGAVEAYERFARRLASEYSTEPSAETQALINAVRSRSVPSDPRPTIQPHRPRTSGASRPTDEPAAPVAPPRGRHGRSLRTAALIGVAGALALAAAVAFTYRRGEHVQRVTLAVLPIQDLAADAAQPYLADALTEQLIADLGRVQELRVINRSTMMTFRGRLGRPRDIARELEADAVLTSAVQRAGDSVRLTVQLVRAGDDRVSWTRSSPSARGDLLRLVRQVADSIAQHTLRRPPPQRTSLGTPRSVDPEALELYVRGRYWWNKRGPGLLRSIELFTAALDRDPTFALAYGGIADAYVQLGYGSLLRPDDAFPKARAAAERALALDSTLAEPHATLGFVRLYYEWDWLGAEREFRRALALNPSYATGHEWYGLFLAAMGRFDEAREHERLAQTLDPLSTAVAGTAAWVLYYAGRNDAAERELRIALRADKTFPIGHLYLGRVHQARGQLDSALAEYRATGPLRAWVPTMAAVGHVYGIQGRRREALATLAQLDSLSRKEYVTAYAVALVHAALGQRDSAFAWLDRGVAERTHWMVWLRRDARWALIRSDPRFEALAGRLRLPQ
jgi:DNA-binding SARP family transcriptional activator/TolB-like protein/Tfp pilus assembly protein PilF